MTVTEALVSLIPEVEPELSMSKHLLELINKKNEKIRQSQEYRAQKQFEAEEDKMCKRLIALARDKFEVFLSTEDHHELIVLEVRQETSPYYPSLLNYCHPTDHMIATMRKLFSELGRVEMKVENGSEYVLQIHLNEFESLLLEG